MNDDRKLIYQSAPRGDEDARVDDKGRLKLPARFLEYLNVRKDSTVYITTFNPQMKMSLIYPSSEWQYRQEVWADLARKGPEMAAAIESRKVVANGYGGDSAIDSQGRVLGPAKLRKEMALENAKVFLSFDEGRFNMWADADYTANLNRALAQASASYDLLKSMGEG